MNLTGEILEIKELSNEDIDVMYKLMDEFYDNMTFEDFGNDLKEKDYCIVLRDNLKFIKGFSTQKIIEVCVKDKKIHGVFSGDTIIHKDYWGSFELHKVFAKFFFDYAEKYEEFYWFLISKGYKTYKMLPTFFKKSYPNYREETPKYIKDIINAFGKTAYSEDFDEASGVIKYKHVKDKLKKGVADIDDKKLKDKDIKFFVEINPAYLKGNDLVCLAKIQKDNLKPTVKRLFYGR
ncbi:MAG: hypothetical protein H7Y18_06240 [Clostridiaceae bacterium]|nr:hypothetical protein [Clostridiaceae bacterium]